MQPQRAMTREDACRILQVAPNADAEIVTQAYWYLARKNRGEFRHGKGAARDRLDLLNQAFLVLHPNPQDAPPLEEAPAPDPNDEPPLIDEIATWAKGVRQQIAARWRGRVPEIAILSGTTAVLGLFALTAGANSFSTLLALAIAAVTIWSPWRRA